MTATEVTDIRMITRPQSGARSPSSTTWTTMDEMEFIAGLGVAGKLTTLQRIYVAYTTPVSMIYQPTALLDGQRLVKTWVGQGMDVDKDQVVSVLLAWIARLQK